MNAGPKLIFLGDIPKNTQQMKSNFAVSEWVREWGNGERWWKETDYRPSFNCNSRKRESDKDWNGRAQGNDYQRSRRGRMQGTTQFSMGLVSFESLRSLCPLLLLLDSWLYTLLSGTSIGRQCVLGWAAGAVCALLAQKWACLITADQNDLRTESYTMELIWRKEAGTFNKARCRGRSLRELMFSLLLLSYCGYTHWHGQRDRLSDWWKAFSATIDSLTVWVGRVRTSSNADTLASLIIDKFAKCCREQE